MSQLDTQHQQKKCCDKKGVATGMRTRARLAALAGGGGLGVLELVQATLVVAVLVVA